VSEYVFNERLSHELFNSLQAAHQFRSLLINPSGGDIGLIKRAQVANQRNADLFIAIHHDSVKDSFLKRWSFDDKTEKYCDDFHGFSIFFSRKNLAAEESKAFAMQLGETLVKAGFTPTLHHSTQEHRPIIDPAKGVYAFDDLLVLKNTKMPAVLLECGVIVNRNEEQDLNSPKYRARMIAAIERAISNFAATQPSAATAN
jgi:N-acetylmuramoyl-L-alanine amidase